ncbi:uncharacterized membrane protein (DUF485 family) [Bradyrhizobium sp. GM5.1]
MSPILSSERTRKILSNPSFRELTAARARLRWGLSIVTLVMFFGFIGLISSASSSLGKSMAGGAIPLGMAIALGMIALVVALTGYYVRRSNTYFDGLTQIVHQECGR